MRRPSIRALLAVALALTVGTAVLVLMTRKEPAALGIKGVAMYPIAGGRALAQVDGEGRITICHRGTALLELGDITADRVLFVDTDLKSLPLPCRGSTPQTLVRIRDIIGRAPRSSPRVGVLDTIENPVLAADRTSLAFEVRDCGGPGFACSSRILLARPGSARIQIALGQLLGWADNTNVVAAHGIWDPIAVDVVTRRRSFPAFPRSWFGRMTPDGRRAFYRLAPPKRTQGIFPAGTFEVDRTAGSRKTVTLDPGALNGSPDRSGSRFIELTGETGPESRSSTIRVYAAGGVQDVFPSPVARTQDCDPDFGWFDQNRAWVFDACGAALADLESRRSTRMTIPELDTAGLEEPVTAFLSLYERIEAPPVDPTLKAARSLSIPIGVNMTVPPSWDAKPCRCGHRPYAEAWIVAGEEPVTIYQGIGYELTIAVTNDTPSRVLRALRAEYAVGKPSPGGRGKPVRTLTTTTERIGGANMTALTVRSGTGRGELKDTIYLRQVGSRTFIVTLYAEGRTDPNVNLGQIRFIG